MRILLLSTLLIVTLGTAGAQAQEAGDPAAGEQVFRKCQACHSLQADRRTVGPHLQDVIGRTAGSVEGYPYSVAMRRSGLVWSPDVLDKFLASPSHFLHGTKMIFTGLRDPKDRANVIAYLRATAEPQQTAAAPAPTPEEPATAEAVESTATAAPAPSAQPADAPEYAATVRYTLRSGIAEGRMVFIGFGGEIDGVVNPTLTAREGDTVQITLINGEGAEHDIVFPDQKIASQHVVGKGASTTISFRASAAGEFVYFCSLPGHREAGMQGKLTIAPPPPPEPPVAAGPDITVDPADVPPPITRTSPERIVVELETVELEGRLADGTTYQYWTFNRTVPGPMLRVRVGDTLEVRLKNDIDSAMIHSVDFHAATGPGGGAAHTQTDPGDTKVVEFKALAPGLYVYHCATPMVAHHIANGMYGLILVEPEGGLPPVDHEFYVMQGEIYTQGRFGDTGSQEFSVDKLLDEDAEYIVFNGAVDALTKQHPMQVKTGETVRVFFGVGGPNYTSSFHVIGEIFDKAYSFADVVSPPLTGVQTVSVPAGGATMVEFTVDVPGRYILVDHALSRLERGLVGFIVAEGPERPEIYKPHSTETAAGH
ncbi:MAG: copper-containing nitrite reductase [Rhodospirillales bacterium]|nr:copper-containing nitrite reductase [Rhodospirillales bacterium]